MSDTLTLYRLQQLDLRIGQIESRLRVIKDSLENNLLVIDAKKRLDAIREELSDYEKSLKEIDFHSQELRVKINQIESSLYGGSIKNPKELQDLEKDITSLKRNLSVMEEQELEKMVAVENLQADHTTALTDYTLVQKQVEEQNQFLTIEGETLSKEAKRLYTERQATTQAITAESLELYERIRLQRHGIAVTTISDNSCDSCGSVITPAQQQSAHHSHQTFRCPSCGRIIYS
jgi:predicted  nucleic acid-binding Zn-ribbon protein